MKNMIRKGMALLIIGLLFSACSTRQRSEGELLADRTTVTVDNQSFSDMTIYVSRGQRVRLGSARGHSKTTFTIPPSIVAGVSTLRFIADPIGSTRSSVSEEISVNPGDSVGLTIPPP
jgi:hypothetical protein